MPKTKKKTSSTRSKTVSVDWNDEDSVKKAMAKALDVDLSKDDLDDFEEDRGLSSFAEGTVYRLSVGRAEYAVARDHDAAEKLAIAVVLQDLKDSPEIFEQSFIQQHIDKDHLRKELHSDVCDSNYERFKDEAKERPMEFLKENNLDIPEPTQAELSKYAEAMGDDETPASEVLRKLKDMGDAEDRWIEMGEEPTVPDKEIEELAEGETEQQLKDPISYLSDIYGDEDAVKKAIEIAGIDEKAAAEEAVRVDGVGHFLSGYDGNIHDGPGGIVYWRTN